MEVSLSRLVGAYGDVEFVESVGSEDPQHSWWSTKRLTVCFVRWVGNGVESLKGFFGFFRQSMPYGTVMFGCKEVDNCYMALFGFPYRFGSWEGLKEHFVKRKSNGTVGVVEVRVYFVLSTVETVDEFVRDCRKIILKDGVEFLQFQLMHDVTNGWRNPFSIGFDDITNGGDGKEPLFLDTAGHMWSCFDQAKSCEVSALFCVFFLSLLSSCCLLNTLIKCFCYLVVQFFRYSLLSGRGLRVPKGHPKGGATPPYIP